MTILLISDFVADSMPRVWANLVTLNQSKKFRLDLFLLDKVLLSKKLKVKEKPKITNYLLATVTSSVIVSKLVLGGSSVFFKMSCGLTKFEPETLM